MKALSPQLQRIVDRLSEGPLTVIEAWEELNILHLTQRIHDLKKMDFVIEKQMIPHINSYRRRTRYARYYLIALPRGYNHDSL